MTGIGDNEWYEVDELELDKNIWKNRMYEDENHEDGCSNP